MKFYDLLKNLIQISNSPHELRKIAEICLLVS